MRAPNQQRNQLILRGARVTLPAFCAGSLRGSARSRPGHQSEIFRSNFLALPVLSDPISIALYISAADIFRLGRRREITVRSPIDCLIAAIAIENAGPVLHQDRDFDAIARYTSLELVPMGSL
jgi:predicted nucleic acid-binding protein